ncbi:hypothetical protein XENOCAPTIV_003044 [Xenoophorus captivus]|uniref:Uncharacterized protein n=1 Tax=Xenoophorus captivus TaxID=1517983 RepID=A0ABV0QUP5_9TELE
MPLAAALYFHNTHKQPHTKTLAERCTKCHTVTCMCCCQHLFSVQFQTAVFCSFCDKQWKNTNCKMLYKQENQIKVTKIKYNNLLQMLKLKKSFFGFGLLLLFFDGDIFTVSYLTSSVCSNDA